MSLVVLGVGNQGTLLEVAGDLIGGTPVIIAGWLGILVVTAVRHPNASNVGRMGIDSGVLLVGKVRNVIENEDSIYKCKQEWTCS